MSNEYEMVKRELLERLAVPMLRTPEYLFDHRDALDELRAVLAQEAGKCEPIYQVMYRGDGGGGWCDADKESYDMKVPHPKHWRVRIVYTSPPAPVSVVLPERRVQPNGFTGKGWAELRGWNACLDKVKELNQ